MDTSLVIFFNDPVSSTISGNFIRLFSLVSHFYLYGVLLDLNFLSMLAFHTHPDMLFLLEIALHWPSHFQVVARAHNHWCTLLCYPLEFKVTLTVLFSEISVSSKWWYTHGIFCWLILFILVIVLVFILILLMILLLWFIRLVLLRFATLVLSVLVLILVNDSLNVRTNSSVVLPLAMVVTLYVLACVWLCWWVFLSDDFFRYLFTQKSIVIDKESICLLKTCHDLIITINNNR